MLKRIFASLLGLMLLQTAPAVLAGPEEAQQVVRETAEKVLDRVKQEREALRKDRKRLHALVDELIIPHFDFNRMARWVLGKHWRKADKEQRRRFVDEFRELLIRTYATALLEYSDEKIEYLPVRAGAGAKSVTVKTVIKRPAGPPIPINYRLRKGKDGWKVFDISVDGVSLISTYRSSFSSQIAELGVDGLIEQLEKKNRSSESTT